MVALVMLSIILVSLARASTVIAVRGRNSDLVAKRTAVLEAEAMKLGAAPFTTLSAWHPVDTTFMRGDFSYRRKLTITAANGANTRYTVKVVVMPTIDPTKADSLIFDRSLPPTGSPLCSGC
jgi:hypothetical protein